jgi:hypothetical protein
MSTHKTDKYETLFSQFTTAIRPKLFPPVTAKWRLLEISSQRVALIRPFMRL